MQWFKRSHHTLFSSFSLSYFLSYNTSWPGSDHACSSCSRCTWITLHHALINLVWWALGRPESWLTGQARADGKQSDSRESYPAPMVSWKCTPYDVTVTDTRLSHNGCTPNWYSLHPLGQSSEETANRKGKKLANIFTFIPLCIETFGAQKSATFW